RYTVVGVTPSRFRGLSLDETPEIWLPLTRYDEVASGFFASFQATDYAAQRGDRRIGLWNVVGRLAPGVTRGAAEADLRRVAAALAEAFPRTNADLSFRTVPAATAAAPLAQRGDSKGLLLLLAGTVGVTLLIACANIANLMLARTARRRRELGVHVALGVGPRRLIRQLLVESGTLALLGGGLGLAVAGWTVELLSRFRLPGGIPIAALDVSLDVRLLAFTLLVSIAAALLFGLAPAVRALRDDPVAALRGDHADRTGHSPLRAGLVTAQVALCLVLLPGAGLFWRSVRAGMEADLGFEPSNVATLTLDLGPLRYGEERAARFYADLVERIRALPGVESASITATPFGEDAGIGVGSVFREGEEASREVGRVTLSRITPGYFTTAGLPLRAGRDFEESDRAGAPLVAIVSEEMAERVWPGADAVGRRFNFSGPGRAMFTVVGVVSDAKRVDLREETSLFAYLPLAQHADAAAGDPMTLYVRTAGPPLAAVAPAREAVGSLDPQVPVHDVMTLEERLAGVLMPQRLGRAVLTLFGGLALLLAVVGTYGVVAYSVSRRTREIGIRRALGAGRIEVVRAAAREGSRRVAIGLLLGAVATLLVTGGLSRFLYGVEARDPVALGLAASLLAAAGAAACLVPAARAGRIEPAEALRHE
ncbi:MAG: ADOP family duplicated permease, partial [Gemmatimonadota bacterium]